MAALFVLVICGCVLMGSCFVTCAVLADNKQRCGMARPCAYVGGFALLWSVPSLLWTFYSPASLCGSTLSKPDTPPTIGVWKCYWCTHPCRESEIVNASTIEDVQRLVARHTKVRVIGTGHATNALYCNGGVLLSLRNICFVSDPQTQENVTTVKVGAGCPIWYVQERLVVHGLHLQGYGAINDQQVGGSIMTALHGAHSSYSFADQLQAVTAVLADGNVHRFDRNNDTFYAWPSSLGTLGVVVDATFQVFPIRVLACNHSTATPERMHALLRDERLDAFRAVTVFPETDFRVTACVLTDLDWRDFTHLFGDAGVETHPSLYQHIGLPLSYLVSNAVPAAQYMQLLATADATTTMLTTAGRSGATYNPFFDQEYSVPLSECRSAIDLLRKHAAHSKHSVIVRKVLANPFWLSWAYRKDVCAIGTSFVDYGKWDAYALHIAYRRNVEREILRRNGSAHPGKLWVSDTSFWSTVQINKFETYRASLDPADKFQNSYTKQLLLQGVRDAPALPPEIQYRMRAWKVAAWFASVVTALSGFVALGCCAYRQTKRCAARNTAANVMTERIHVSSADTTHVGIRQKERSLFLKHRK